MSCMLVSFLIDMWIRMLVVCWAVMLIGVLTGRFSVTWVLMVCVMLRRVSLDRLIVTLIRCYSDIWKRIAVAMLFRVLIVILKSLVD